MLENSLRKKAESLLKRSLNNNDATFHDGQWEAVERLVQDKSRLLVVQRTGWGKSVVYFLATRLLRDTGAGPTLLISPLLALMRNQILAATRIGIRAATINSSNLDEWTRVRDDLRANKIDLLLVSPERLGNEEFREKVLMPMASRIGLLVVDEAHCISDWGHDFRPDYLRIVRIVQALPRNIPVLTTTATANDRVVSDIVEQLGSQLGVVRGALARESLRLQNIILPNKAARMAWLAEHVPKLPGSGIIYTLTVRDSERVAEWLQKRGLNARAYHSDVRSEDREALEAGLLANEVKALVATTALGMGFDKPDLGFVIHFQRPASVVHYYQQVGRAGRALDKAYAILLCGEEDDEIADYFIRTAFPPEAHTNDVLVALAGSPDGLTVPMLQREINLSKAQIEKVLKRLSVEQPSPIVKLDRKWCRTPVAYKYDGEKVERLTGIRRREQSRMQKYMRSEECLMAFLRRELDDPVSEPCGKCAVCAGKPLVPATFSTEKANAAVQYLQRCYQVIEPRAQWMQDALVDHGWKGKISEKLTASPGRSLCVWGDAGWGNTVREGKVGGHFDDELVTATAEMIQEHWKPIPAPQWITCVPSLKHLDLIPNFSQRLANALGLPFIPCVRKKRETPPQKEMCNSYRQSQNLANAFEVNKTQVKGTPVLLVDDMVDSRWTFTVIAAHLREAGCGPVYPVALAVTTAG